MTEPVLDEVELMAMIDELKRVSPGEQEAAIEALEGDHPGVGERARALLALERRAEEITRKLEEAEAAFKKPEARVEPVAARPKPKLVETTKPDEPREWRFVQRADGSKWMVRGKDWRRHFGPVPQLKVVEQAKPEDKPEPEVEVEVEVEVIKPGLVEEIGKLELELAAKKKQSLFVTGVDSGFMTPGMAAQKPVVALNEMNKKHAVITNLGGKCVVME